MSKHKQKDLKKIKKSMLSSCKEKVEIKISVLSHN